MQTWYAGHYFDWKALGSDTGGQFALVDALGRPGFEPPLHVHTREDEAYYLISGRMTFVRGDERIEAGPGDYVWLPRDVPHAFTFDTEDVRTLILITPAGLDDYFLEMSEPAGAPELPPVPDSIDVEAMDRLLTKAGVTMVGPPLRAAS